MTDDRALETALGAVAGTTNITGRALQRLAVGIARDSAQVSARDVSVTLADEQGALRVSVTIPVALAAGRDATIVEDGDELRQGVVDGMRELAGRTVGSVDVRYSGVRRMRKKRVR